MQRHLAVLAAVAMMATFLAIKPAHAQDSWWYAGASLHYGDFAGISRQDSGWRGFFGYEFTPNYAVELAYTDLGSVRQRASIGTRDLNVRLAELGGIGAFELSDRITMFGLLGWFRDETEQVISLTGLAPERFSERNSNYTYAIGIRFNLRPHFGVRGNWQRYRKVGDITDVDVYSVGLVARFGGR